MFDLLITAPQLKEHLNDRNVLLFDVRHNLQDHDAGRRAYEAGHIPGALFLDHERDLSAQQTGTNGRHPLPPLREFAALMRAYGLTSRTQVFAYDDSAGMYAAHLWWMLRWLGHRHVAILDGGWSAWLAAGGDTETEVRVRRITEAQALQSGAAGRGPAMPVLDAQAVLENLETGDFTVVDARAEERFRGEIEPMDPVAGHIPGALNRPTGRNVDEKGRFKSPEALRAEYERLLAGREPTQIVHQCGSGISACHNLFAMELAGLGGSALYPGSWSEWCSDPARPVARGAEAQ